MELIFLRVQKTHTN